MTDVSERRPPEPGLYVTDAELIRRMGVPEKIAREAIRALDASAVFPRSRSYSGTGGITRPAWLGSTRQADLSPMSAHRLDVSVCADYIRQHGNLYIR
jgi:hypothetical protein